MFTQGVQYALYLLSITPLKNCAPRCYDFSCNYFSSQHFLLCYLEEMMEKLCRLARSFSFQQDAVYCLLIDLLSWEAIWHCSHTALNLPFLCLNLGVSQVFTQLLLLDTKTCLHMPFIILLKGAEGTQRLWRRTERDMEMPPGVIMAVLSTLYCAKSLQLRTFKPVTEVRRDLWRSSCPTKQIWYR